MSPRDFLKVMQGRLYSCKPQNIVDWKNATEDKTKEHPRSMRTMRKVGCGLKPDKSTQRNSDTR